MNGTTRAVTRNTIARGAIALVWLYNGLWCKLVAVAPDHHEVVSRLPHVDPTLLLAAIGLIEIGLAAWVLTNRKPLAAACAQTALLVGMNAGGLIWSQASIPNPAEMVINNVAFLCLVWAVVPVERQPLHTEKEDLHALPNAMPR